MQRFPPLWAWAVILPLPLLLFWRSDVGPGYALCLYFIGCANVVARAFRRGPELEPADFDVPPKQIWHGRLRNLLKPLLLAFVVFSLISFATSPHDPSEIILALLILVPSLCLVPHMTMVTGQAFAGVVLSVFLVFCMKLLGCIVVVLVYGWSASDRDYTTTPWMAPNLLVCLFCLNCSVLCAVLYMLGRRRFEAKYSGSVACR
jgi:hypothetical protein